MSRGPGRWQRAILDELQGRGVFYLREVLPTLHTRSDQLAVLRAAHRLASRGLITISAGRRGWSKRAQWTGERLESLGAVIVARPGVIDCVELMLAYGEAATQPRSPSRHDHPPVPISDSNADVDNTYTLERAEQTLRDAPDDERLTAPLVKVGADPRVVRRVLEISREPPLLLLIFPVLAGPAMALRERWTRLYRLSQQPCFTEYSSALQEAVLRELETLLPQWMETDRRCAEPPREMLTTDPLLAPWVEAHTARHAPRGRGQPSHPGAQLFMAVMTAHLKARCGRCHYAVVGEVARALFPECLDGEAQLEEAVRAQVRRFRRRHSVPQLLAALTRPRPMDTGDEPITGG